MSGTETPSASTIKENSDALIGRNIIGASCVGRWSQPRPAPDRSGEVTAVIAGVR
jgi:hypothetical protein